MLVPIVVLLAFLLTLTTALLEHSLTATKIATGLAVARYSDVAANDGVADFTTALATYVAAHGSSGPWPSAPSTSFPRTSCDAATLSAPCPFSVTITSRITQPAGAAKTSVPPDAARNVQTTAIAENRVSAVVTATISTTGGTLLGARTRLLTYRVFEVPPYAIVAGSRDTATGSAAGDGTPGDSGGALGNSGGVPAAPAGAATAERGNVDDTRIHVLLACSTVTPNVVPFKNDQQPAGNDALPWGNDAAKAYEAPCKKPAASADAFADRTWSNGNAGESGWTP